MWQSYQDNIIVKMDKVFEENVSFEGENGQRIMIDPRFDPMKNARIYGEVVSMPTRLNPIPVTQEHKGMPGYLGASPFKYKYMNDIVQDVQVGDRAYFHFNTAINKNNWVDVQGTHPNKTWYVRVRYDAMLAVVRDEKIIMIGGWVLAEPDKEDWDDILIPVPQVVNGKPLLDKNGEILLKPKEQWIQTKVEPDTRALKAFVRHIDEPLKGDVRECNPGDHIVYRKFADWPLTVEGKEYFCIRQSHILGRFQLN